MQICLENRRFDLVIFLAMVREFSKTKCFLSKEIVLGNLTGTGSFLTLELYPEKICRDFALFADSFDINANRGDFFEHSYLRMATIIDGRPQNSVYFIRNSLLAEFLLYSFSRNGIRSEFQIYWDESSNPCSYIRQEIDSQQLKRKEFEFLVKNILYFQSSLLDVCNFGFRICADIGAGDWRFKIFDGYIRARFFELLGCLGNMLGDEFKIVIDGNMFYVEFEAPIMKFELVCNICKK